MVRVCSSRCSKQKERGIRVAGPEKITQLSEFDIDFPTEINLTCGVTPAGTTLIKDKTRLSSNEKMAVLAVIALLALNVISLPCLQDASTGNPGGRVDP